MQCWCMTFTGTWNASYGGMGMTIKGWDDWLDGTPVEGRSRIPKSKQTYKYQKTKRSVDAAGRRDAGRTVPVNYNGSRQMARNPHALLEHPSFAPKRSLRHSGKGVNPHNMQYNLQPPRDNSLCFTVVEHTHERAVYLHKYARNTYRIIVVEQGVARRSIEYLSGPHAQMRYEKGTITWDREKSTENK